ncbi:hypothetical protein DICSQDRAFT_125084 [Dichomitus squalens LYAD-421 SS1]|uniref:uncharacterized protein n=1 Tax=Dichomitus squalens (strain LYAD-421) TaxID=732165 RepID=UPI0004413424|nr:uncharacterized protein DICSQDRAFT_125084 [Dichomitus squalens LYAD-421 SS1]EJF64978.1 hypothetical protein DICSQDRAFT_125084 [Dichomitus squalens LYAD-421 SS1]
MAANTITTLSRVASSLAGPVSTANTAATTTTTTLQKTKFPANHRPTASELNMILSTAANRANKRRTQQALGLGLPPKSVPRRPRREIPIPPKPKATTIRTGRTILSPIPGSPSLAPYHPAPNAPKLGTLPTHPETPPPVPAARPRFPTRRSRVAPFKGVGLGLPLDVVGEDPILTPGHVFPDTLCRTPGAPARRAAVAKTGETASYFHLPSDLLATPAQPTPLPQFPKAVMGLGFTVPASVGLGATIPTMGLGITEVYLGEEDRVELTVPVN